MMKILIAATDSEMLDNVNVTLDLFQSDWKLATANSGEQCLDILKNDSCPDVVILGINPADTTGLNVIGQIRDFSDVAVIVLSGDNSELAIIKAFALGADDYIVRPFNQLVFLARVKAAIRRRQWNIHGMEEN